MKSTKLQKAKTRIPPRIPIQLTHEEDEKLTALCEKEQRSKAAMARIIYQLGFKTYTNRRKP